MAVLLERDGELAALRRALAAAAAGRGSIAVVAGEAGIGKSSLVQAWCADAGSEARILLGWCDDFITSRALGPLHDVARRAGGPLAEAVRAGDVGGVLDALLAELAYPLAPTVVVLEDLHWADDATLDVVRYVGRRIAALPAMLVLTYRDDEVGPAHPLTGVLGALAAGPVHHVVPRPLSRRAVAALVDGSGLDPDEVGRVTGGNPFFVTEVAGSASAVPASVGDAVLARLGKLPEAAQRAIEALAVVPGALGDDLVRALVADLEGIAAGERAGVLVRDGAAVRFRHELARRAVLASVPATMQLLHHRTVLDHALGLAGDPPGHLRLEDMVGPGVPAAEPGLGDGATVDHARLLHHAVGADRVEAVIAFGVHAAHQAFVTGAYRQAVGHQDRLLPHADALHPVDLAVLLCERAWALYNLHRQDEAVAAAQRSADIFGELGDVQGRCRVLLTVERMCFMANRPDDAVAALDEAAALLPACEPVVHAEVRSHRLSLLALRGRHEEVLVEAPAAIAAAEAVERADLVAHDRNYLGGSKVRLGDVDGGLEDLRQALRMAQDAGWAEAAARAFTNLVSALVLARRWGEADDVIARAIGFYDDHDYRAHRYDTLAERGNAALWRGDWGAARELSALLSASAAEAGALAAMAYDLEARLAVRSGAPDAEASLRQAWDEARATGASHHLVRVGCTAVEWAWSVGRPEAAAQFLEVLDDVGGPPLLLGALRWRLPLVGREADPRGVVVEPERTSLRGDWHAAARRWQALEMPYEQALELLRSGEREPTLEALALLERLGARPAASIARSTLRALGVRSIPRGPVAATKADPQGLTPRQVEVLALLADGLTNAEIADRLVVSVRTVDHHVSAVLHKLGVATRREAARHAAVRAAARAADRR